MSLTARSIKRLNRVQNKEMCRSCLAEDNLMIIENDPKIMMVLSKCYGGMLTLSQAKSKFICEICFRRLESNYEFLCMVNETQRVVDTYINHGESCLGEAANERLLKEGLGLSTTDEEKELVVEPSGIIKCLFSVVPRELLERAAANRRKRQREESSSQNNFED